MLLRASVGTTAAIFSFYRYIPAHSLHSAENLSNSQLLRINFCRTQNNNDSKRWYISSTQVNVIMLLVNIIYRLIITSDFFHTSSNRLQPTARIQKRMASPVSVSIFLMRAVGNFCGLPSTVGQLPAYNWHILALSCGCNPHPCREVWAMTENAVPG